MHAAQREADRVRHPLAGEEAEKLFGTTSPVGTDQHLAAGPARVDPGHLCGSPQIVEGLRLRGVRDGCRGGLLVIDRWHHASGAVPALVVVEPVGPVDDDGPGLGPGVELVPGQDFPLQGGEERLGGGVVEALSG